MLSNKEQQIRDRGVQLGKSNVEIMQAIANYRTSEKDKPTFSGVGNIKETLSDLKQGAGNVLRTFRETGENIVETAQRPDLNLAEKATTIGAEAFRGGSRAVVAEPILTIGRAALTEKGEERVSEAVGGVAEGVASQEFVKNLAQRYAELPPDVQQQVNNVLGFGEGLLDIATLGAGKAVGRSVRQVAKEAIETTKQAVSSATKNVVQKGIDLVPRRSQTLAEILSPKITAKEGRKIITEGRVTRPKESILFGKQPDIITPEESVQKAADLLQERIPNIKNLDEFELANAIEDLNTRSANTLKPQFQSVDVSPDVVDNAISRWDELKRAQADEPEFVAFSGGNKFQERFGAFLQEAQERVRGADGRFRQKNLDDIWEIRKRYDQSIPTSVKEATRQSAPSTQLQRDMWLQNRRILNDILFEMSENLDDAARETFEEMSLLYEARQNLITKGKIDVKGSKGLITKNGIIKTLGAGALGKFLLFE